MNEPKLVDALAKKENQALTSLLFIGLIGSTCVHAAAIITPVPTLWKTTNKELDDTIEIVVEVNQSTEEKVPEIAKEPEPIPPVNEEVPQMESAPVAIALAPETITPIKEGKDAAAPDDLKPLTNQNTSDVKVPLGGGSIIANNGIGSGFGNNKIPTGFILGGKKNGNPDGKKNGVIGGITNGKQDPKGTQKGTQTSVLPPVPPVETRAVKLECLSCPKPQYRGKEGTPRVTYDIAPDGRVMNVRLRQSSGDEQTDRETLEAMSKWQFNPQTIPEGGRTNVKVRVTFEEEGSKFQRQNEERRRQEAEQLASQEAEQRKLAEDRRQREAEAPKSTAVNAPVNAEPARSLDPPMNSAEPTSTPVQPIVNSPVPNVIESVTAPVVDNPPPIAPPPPPIEAPITPEKPPSASQ